MGNKSLEKIDHINLLNVSTNNLKHIDVAIPLNQLTVVTGVSGSGKSSLVFDTLYAEAYRRFVDSLSSYARQYLKTLPKPEIESVQNLPPAIAVKQGRSPSNQRSTVGTLTELTHLTQALFMHLASIQCYNCGRKVQKHTASSIVQELEDILPTSAAIRVLAPLDSWSGLAGTVLKKQLQEQGFARVLSIGETFELKALDPKLLHSASLIIDRFKWQDSDQSRLSEAVQLALKVSRGFCVVEGEGAEPLLFSSNLECSFCKISYLPPSMALFSFNHPLGACDSCHGYGRVAEIDWNKIIPNRALSIKDGGIAPLNFGAHNEYYGEFRKSAKKHKINLSKPFANYSDREWTWLQEGLDEDFGGMKAYFEWLNSQKYKAHYRIHAARFNTYRECPSCKGKRYSRDTLAYKIDGKNIADVHELSVKEFQNWAEQSKGQRLDQEAGLREAFEEVDSRIHYLLKVGLSYLNLNRVSGTLSGGELQRIHMAACIGSSLTDSMYCLDEPSSGLHARDSKNLLEVICELRDQGNTVVVVEHDKQIISGSDYLIEIGPGSGHLGGKISYQGHAKVLDQAIAYPKKKASACTSFLKLQGAKTHNLKNVTVEIPIGKMTVVCGVSGSGKTSLIQHTLLPFLQAALKHNLPSMTIPGKIGPTPVLNTIKEVLFIDQKVLARSSRSNIATYLGVFDRIRGIFASQDKAKELKLTAGSFSFNVPGGRCENCKGLGTVEEDLSFLGEVDVTCPQCEGRRFHQTVLSVKYRGKNLLEILSLTVHEAYEVFYDNQEISETLKPILELGLGYLTLGQATSSFSGGEAQRLKLLSLLTETGPSGKTMVLIFDEPTTGLSDKDVYNLWKHLDFLTQKGHTVIVIEHNMDIIKCADHIIDIGPDGGNKGGKICFSGTPEELATVKNNYTGAFLAKELVSKKINEIVGS